MKKLLVIDNDWTAYDTPQALDGAIRRIDSPWSYEVVTQSSIPTNTHMYSAVLIDNDFGDGIQTLANLKGIAAPIAYVTAYDRQGLELQFEHQPNAQGITPHDLVERVTLIQKPGKTISKDVQLVSLENQLYEFANSISIDSM